MNFNQLRYIVEIVETGSISKAASNLFISQPNLSSQIASLEQEIGKSIFNRSNRGVTLTSYGVEVYQHAKTMVGQYRIIEKKIFANTNLNKIKIASFGCEIINSKFFEVCEKFNSHNYEFELYECGVENAIQRVMDRDSDMAIIIYSDYQKKKLMQFLSAESLELHNLFEGRLKVHMSKNAHLSKKKLIDSQDLQGLFEVRKSYIFEGMFALHHEMEQFGIPQNNKTILTNGNKTYNDALHNLPSFAVEIDWKCNRELPSGLVRIPFEGPETIIMCAMVKRSNEILKEELQFFVNKLIEEYR